MMHGRLGLGPVFAIEWLTTCRRWQVYALRSAFVSLLLAGMLLVRWSWTKDQVVVSPSLLARIGEALFQAIAGTQLALILMAAPAATAGSICMDKVRGNLAHLLATDLSNSEIVLGKLAARLAPVLGFVLGSLPVMALGTFLGGIDPIALVGAYLIAIGVAVFGCSLALTLSVWGTKTYEVLLITYGIWAVWLLLGAMWTFASALTLGIGPPAWLGLIDPFALTFVPYENPSVSWLGTQAGFAGVLIALSAALTALAILRVRSVAVRHRDRVARARRIWSVGEAPRRLMDSVLAPLHLAGPSLDPNPVLWRECRRRRPSLWTRLVWALYYGLVTLFSLAIIITLVWKGSAPGPETAALINAFAVTIGLLLICLSAPTTLSEERSRGSLDILMSTTLPTRSIVWGKWWGVFRPVPWVAFWPTLICIALWIGRWGEPWYTCLVPPLMVLLVLSSGAFYTSLGLALATWTHRLARALVLTVVTYVVLTLGWVLIVMLVFERSGGFEFVLTEISPFWGSGLLTVLLEQQGMGGVEGKWILWGALAASVIQASLAGGLLALTLTNFDRCLGRVRENSVGSSRRLAPGPRKAQASAPDMAEVGSTSTAGGELT